jgi:hypothetical protein
LFTGDEKLSVGQTFTFSVWLLCASAAAGASNVIRLAEEDGDGENDLSGALYTLAGGEGYVQAEVSHTVTDSDSDRLRVKISADDGETIDFDGAMLIHGDRALYNFRESSLVLNEASASGTVSADKADVIQWDVWGYDVDTVAHTHPWRRIEKGENVFGAMRKLAGAIAPSYFGPEESGTFKSRSALTAAFTEPAPLFVIDGASDVIGGMSVGEMATINRLEGHGAFIKKSNSLRLMWDARAGDTFELNEDNEASLNESVLNGATWPTESNFWARYGHTEFDTTEPEVEEPEVDELSDWELFVAHPFRYIFSDDYRETGEVGRSSFGGTGAF